MKDKFDIDVFNKIYQENKIADNYDEGYGSWMKQNPTLESSQQRLFQNGFNKDMFNATFEQYKQQQSKQYSEQLSLLREWTCQRYPLWNLQKWLPILAQS